jgi:hypothetical protein
MWFDHALLRTQPSHCGATLPRAIKTIPDAVAYLREVFKPKKDAPLQSLESLFAAIETEKK